MALRVHTQGLQYLLEVAFTGQQTKPANFYAFLCEDTDLAVSAVLGDQTELSGFGYARQPIVASAVGWTSASDGAAGRKVTSIDVTFTASGGDWVRARTLGIATTLNDSGVLLASGPIEAGVGTLRTNGTSYSAKAVLTLP